LGVLPIGGGGYCLCCAYIKFPLRLATKRKWEKNEKEVSCDFVGSFF